MSMFDRYDNIPEGYIPNNRPIKIEPRHIAIMMGETTTHSFELPFNAAEVCRDVEIIYKQGLHEVFHKSGSALEILPTHGGHCSIVSCHLGSGETSYFRDNVLDVKVQLKFYMKDYTVAFSEIYDVEVTASLETSCAPGPGPGIIYGFGYTED